MTNRIADAISWMGFGIVYSILILALVVMSSVPASAHSGGTIGDIEGGCHTGSDGSSQPGYHCHPDTGWDWGGVAVVLGAAVIIHILAGDDSPWAYSPAPPNPDAIDWGFNATPDETTVTIDIPISF